MCSVCMAEQASVGAGKPAMSTVKVRAHQRIITDDCRRNRGEHEAVDEAMRTSTEAAKKLLKHWPLGAGTKIIVTVEVEYPDDPDAA